MNEDKAQKKEILSKELQVIRKIAWPWIPARQGQIAFDEWSELVRWVTDSEVANEKESKGDL